MPTIALTNSIAFANVPDVERDFPRIRVMGTIGWIASGLACGFLPQMLGYADISPTNIPLLITAGSSALLGVFCVFPARHAAKSTGKMDIKVMLGSDALILLRDKKLPRLFLLFIPVCDATGVLLHLCQRLSDRSWHENATGWMTLGQFSEIFFMLALPFSLNALVSKRYYCLVWSPLRSAMASLFTVVRMNISPTRYCSSVFCFTA